MCAPVGSLRTCRKANVHVVPASLLAAVDPGFLAPRRYGKIVSTKAILDKTTNKCKGEQLGWVFYIIGAELQADAAHVPTWRLLACSLARH